MNNESGVQKSENEQKKAHMYKNNTNTRPWEQKKKVNAMGNGAK